MHKPNPGTELLTTLPQVHCVIHSAAALLVDASRECAFSLLLGICQISRSSNSWSSKPFAGLFLSTTGVFQASVSRYPLALKRQFFFIFDLTRDPREIWKAPRCFPDNALQYNIGGLENLHGHLIDLPRQIDASATLIVYSFTQASPKKLIWSDDHEPENRFRNLA